MRKVVRTLFLLVVILLLLTGCTISYLPSIPNRIKYNKMVEEKITEFASNTDISESAKNSIKMLECYKKIQPTISNILEASPNANITALLDPNSVKINDDIIRKYRNDYIAELETKKVDYFFDLGMMIAGDVIGYTYFTNSTFHEKDEPFEINIFFDPIVLGTWLLVSWINLDTALNPKWPEEQLQPLSSFESYLRARVAKARAQFMEKVEATLRKINEKRAIEQKYGKWYKYVQNKELAVGMPAWVVKDILGEPANISKTTTAFGVFEQWTYEKYNWRLGMYWPYLYLYFEDGILVSWQTVE